MIADTILAELRAAVGPSGLKTGEDVKAIHPGEDPHNLDAEILVSPSTVEQVAAVVSICNTNGVSIVPQGGRTGLVGGGVSTPGQIVLSLTGLNRIEALSTEAGTVVVESGVTLYALQQSAAAVGLSTGIDIASRGSATIGGMISTNAGGMEAFRQGVMRHRVLGLEVVLPDGSIMSDLAEVTKSNEGYDLKQLFIGAEGTLGIVTRAVLKLAPRDEFTATALVACPSVTQAVSLFQQLQRRRDLHLLRAEFMARPYFALASGILAAETLAGFTEAPSYLILEAEADDQLSAQVALENALSAAFEDGLATDAIIAQSEKERLAIWLVREDSDVVTRACPQTHWFDISVPLQHLETYLQQFDRGVASLAGVSGFAFGHLGDGNLHIGVSCADGTLDKKDAKAIVYANLQEMGGSFSAEHGIGTDKLDELRLLVNPVKLALMKSVKNLFDPKGIMNPGKVIF